MSQAFSGTWCAEAPKVEFPSSLLPFGSPMPPPPPPPSFFFSPRRRSLQSSVALEKSPLGDLPPPLVFHFFCCHIIKDSFSTPSPPSIPFFRLIYEVFHPDRFFSGAFLREQVLQLSFSIESKFSVPHAFPPLWKHRPASPKDDACNSPSCGHPLLPPCSLQRLVVI